MRATILSRGGEKSPTTIELVLPPGGVTPLHVHEDDEDSGIVLEGNIKTWCDGELLDVAHGWMRALLFWHRDQPPLCRSVSSSTGSTS